VDAVIPLAGAFPPGEGEVVLEHLSLEQLGLQIGDTLVLEMDNGAVKKLPIVGAVHDPQQLAPEIFGISFGYVTPDTMGSLGEIESFSELRLRADDPNAEDAEVQAVIDRVEKQIEDSGRPVLDSAIPEKFIRAVIDTLLIILSTFGVTILLLSGFLVVNAISALITQQVQQIGVMKLIGARRSQIMSLYLVTVLVYGIIAVGIGVPFSVWSARYFMTWRIEHLLNIVPQSYAIPAPLLIGQTVIGLSLPVLSGLLPVWRGTRISTFQALNDVGVENRTPQHGPLEYILVRLQRLGVARRPLVLSMRNTLRHKGRLVQTLFVLIFGTALFVGVLTVRASVDETIHGFLRFHQYDVSIALEQPTRIARLQQVALGVPGVVSVEGWSQGSAARVRADDSKGSRMPVNAVPAGSKLMAPRVEAGRWLLAGDENVIVVNSDVMEDEPDLALGDDVVLEIAGRESTWRLVGVVPTLARGPAVYLPYDSYAYVTHTPGSATLAQVVTTGHDAASEQRMEEKLYQAFEEAGYAVAGTNTSQHIRSRYELMFNLVVIFLIIMALLLAAVGGLGLTTTMSINVLERIREIGVLRAIGATNMAVRRIVLAEGMVIGLLSWSLGIVLSLPVGAVMSEQVGMALLGVPLSYRYSVSAATMWFFALLTIAVVASLGPARNAVRLTVREVLAYE
jgi:putative ABC transport system permease protein